MKRSIRLLIALVLLAALTSLVFAGCAVAGTKPSALSQNSDEQTTDKNPTQPVEDPETVTPTTPSNPGSEVTPTNPTNPEVNPGGDTPDTPEVTLTEAEYKALFLEELPETIENYYNAHVSINSIMDISQVTLKEINYSNGNIYLNVMGTNNRQKFFIANLNGLNDQNSYEDAYSLIDNNASFTFSKAYSIQEQSLANEIAEFALEQDAVKDYLTQNGISSTSNYEVLNATEFNGTTKGRISDLVIKLNNKIFTLSIGGTTGVCNSQEEYLNKLKNGRLSVLENFEISNYSELSSASESYTFTSSYGGLKGTMVYNNHGAGCPQFEEMSM